jgi:hypothetical protein
LEVLFFDADEVTVCCSSQSLFQDAGDGGSDKVDIGDAGGGDEQVDDDDDMVEEAGE